MDTLERELTTEQQQEIVSLSEQAKQLAEIKTDADMEWAGQFQSQLKLKRKEIEDFFKPEIEAAHQLHKKLCAKLKTFTDPIDQAIAITSPAIGSFIRKRQMEQQAAQEKAAKIADKKGLPPPPPANNFQAPKGISTTSRWEVEVVNLGALVRAAAAMKVPLISVEANIKFLTQQATSLKNLFDFPGVKAKEVIGTQTRTGGVR